MAPLVCYAMLTQNAIDETADRGTRERSGGGGGQRGGGGGVVQET